MNNADDDDDDDDDNGGPGLQDQFLIDFGSQHGLSWVQIGVKLASESMFEGSQERVGWGPGIQDRF